MNALIAIGFATVAVLSYKEWLNDWVAGVLFVALCGLMVLTG